MTVVGPVRTRVRATLIRGGGSLVVGSDLEWHEVQEESLRRY